MNAEQQRLSNKDWKKWGSYVTDRQWGTVREDYSANGDAWNFTTHHMAVSKAYRWGEEGIAGWCDTEQTLCFALAFWNKKDEIIKERLFGLSNSQGNHGEDVKELYYYLDATPTHSYMKMLYKYPQQQFPYNQLINENQNRSKQQDEYELIDTGIFDNDEYFDITIEYAKANVDDILIKITIENCANSDAAINVLPTIWFRNTWDYGLTNNNACNITSDNNKNIVATHNALGTYTLYTQNDCSTLFCNNETNNQLLYNATNKSNYTKDGINNFIVNNQQHAVNANAVGTKAAMNYDVVIKANSTTSFCLRLTNNNSLKNPFENFDQIFNNRIKEANEFYDEIQIGINNDDEKLVQRQAFAGMIWSKQFYYYDVHQWLYGDKDQMLPPVERLKGRNSTWQHLSNKNIISMPDKWEYPWYASWDLAFHCIPLAMIDSNFAKNQLLLLTKVWYMHPNGQLPAYEWKFEDVNPPVHAWSTFRVFKMDEKQNGKPDIEFLETVFHKLLFNFNWWVNKKDFADNNIFEGGFLGLDNIGVFDRSASLPFGGYIEQADGTSWMAMYCLNLMRIAMELSQYNNVYEDLAIKFFEHFLYIAQAIDNLGENSSGLWSDDDGFFFDKLMLPNGTSTPLKVYSLVGLIPLFAVEVIDHELLQKMPRFNKRLQWLYDNKPEFVSLVSRWNVKSPTEKHLLSLLRGHRMKLILKRMLHEDEFLSTYGIRSVSKIHKENPYQYWVNDKLYEVNYVPGDSDSGMFGGNSNWRGPIWMPMNFLIIESLRRFHFYYGDDFKIEYPTNSGNFLTLNETAQALSQRLANLFLKDDKGSRAIYGTNTKLQFDDRFKNLILFYEYFNGDTGKGVGASHQTGWTGLIAKLLQPR